MIIKKVDLEVTTPPCEPGAERFGAIARLVEDIREVLPYLNATLRGAVYNAAGPTLTWKKGGHNIVFHPYQIAVSNVADRETALREVQELVELVNRTWERRGEIQPDWTTRRRVGPMDIYNLLPRTNCRACGQPTCYTFALKLALGQVRIHDCPLLHEPAYAAELAQLQALVPEDRPAIA
jgi:ArsR family metal-binding transcriptional regulator